MMGSTVKRALTMFSTAFSTALLVTGCQTAPIDPASSNAWVPLNKGLLDIAVNEQALGVSEHSARRKLVDGRFDIQDGQWRGAGGWPRVRLLMHDLSGSRLTFAEDNPFNQPLRDRISKAFGTYPIAFGGAGEFPNRLGTIRVQRFSVNGTNQCVFVGQFTSPSNELRAGDGEELGQIYIEGSYCDRPGNSVTTAELESFIFGIDLRNRLSTRAARPLSVQ